jgi:DNA-directed RNA polymerase subunit K/omega
MSGTEDDDLISMEENNSNYTENILDDVEQTDEDIHLTIYNKDFNSFNNIYDLTNIKHSSNMFITKYEKTKVLGMRAQQLASGCPALVEIPKSLTNVLDIAYLEYKQKKLPFIIERKMPNKCSEYLKLSDLSDLR